jgi:hypothetical protein
LHRDSTFPVIPRDQKLRVYGNKVFRTIFWHKRHEIMGGLVACTEEVNLIKFVLNVTSKWLTFLPYMCEVPGSYLWPRDQLPYLTMVFLSPSRHMLGWDPKLGCNLFFPIHYLLIILSFDTT